MTVARSAGRLPPPAPQFWGEKLINSPSPQSWLTFTHKFSTPCRTWLLATFADGWAGEQVSRWESENPLACSLSRLLACRQTPGSKDMGKSKPELGGLRGAGPGAIYQSQTRHPQLLGNNPIIETAPESCPRAREMHSWADSQSVACRPPTESVSKGEAEPRNALHQWE